MIICSFKKYSICNNYANTQSGISIDVMLCIAFLFLRNELLGLRIFSAAMK